MMFFSLLLQWIYIALVHFFSPRNAIESSPKKYVYLKLNLARSTNRNHHVTFIAYYRISPEMKQIEWHRKTNYDVCAPTIMTLSNICQKKIGGDVEGNKIASTNRNNMFDKPEKLYRFCKASCIPSASNSTKSLRCMHAHTNNRFTRNG